MKKLETGTSFATNKIIAGLAENANLTATAATATGAASSILAADKKRE